MTIPILNSSFTETICPEPQVGTNGIKIIAKEKTVFMKKTRIICIALASALAVACVKKEEGLSQDKLAKIQATATGSETKRLVTENTYLDVDIEKLNKELNDRTKNKYQKPELAKARAVLYRFYSHVHLEDDQYVCSLKSAEEINISEKFFRYLIDGLQKTNADIKAMKAKDPKTKIELPQITPQYLQGLIQ